MSKKYQTQSFLFKQILFIYLLFFLIGCQSQPTELAASDIPDPIVTQSTPVAPGAEVGIKMELPPQSGEISYSWRTDDGEFIGGGGNSSAVIWKAPNKPGTSIIYVEVSIDGVTTEKSVFIAVEATPTSTSTPTSTPTPAPTGTPTNTPTSTPPPTETFTPTPSLTPTVPPTPCPYESVHVPLPQQSTDVTVTISSPHDCSTVPTTTVPLLISGSYDGDLTGKELWVFVVPEFALDFFVQSAEACDGAPADASGNQWNTLVVLGGPPQSYDIVVVVAEEGGTASQAFRARLLEGCQGSLGGYTQQEMSQFDVFEAASITIFKEDEE